MKAPGLTLHLVAAKLLDDYLRSPSHAVLLAGPGGTGKTIIATALAGELLHATSLANQPHYRAVVPQNGSIGIDQIRNLINFFRLKVPGKAAIKRVAVIQDAETMGTEAQNALLKALEEPPAGTVLILTSSQPEHLLPTIRSRTQLLHLPAPDKAQLQQHFAAEGYAAQAVAAALLRGGTNIAEAKRLLEAGTDNPDTAVSLVKQALGGTAYDRLLLVDGLAKQKDAAHEFTSTLATVAMASLEAAAQKGATTVTRWQTVLQAAHTAQDALALNGNAKLVLTELMLAL